jgi:transcriptional regulator with XRE-family HTH domain
VELARSLEPSGPAEQRSVLAALRIRRRLTIEEAAKRAALWPEQVEWLEEGSLSRFPTSEAAMLALVRYATSLGIDHRQARRLSGLPVEPPRRKQVARWAAAAAGAALVAVLLTALALALSRGPAANGEPGRPSEALPAPWRVTVDVLNGGGDINYTRRLASRVGAFGYRLGHVTRATRFDYRQTVVYFEPGGEALARRLSAELGCGTTSPLPGGTNERRLVVIAGPPSAACAG